MRALILSGGKGTRLRPITHTSAKQLVPVANKPILFYGIEAMREAGITEVGIVVGDTHQEIRDAVGDGSRFGVKVTYIRQEAPLGLAHAVLVSEAFLGDQPFVMYLGDNLVRDGIRPLVEEFRRDRPNSQILLAHVKNPEEFGVAELDGGRVVRLEEKPAQPRSDLALVGVYMFDAHVFEAVKAIRPSRRGELEITDAIQYLIDKKFDVRSHVIGGWWKDTGKLEDMLEANRMMLENLEPKNSGTLDAKSRLEGRVVIGAGTRVENSLLRGPLIVGERCVIRGAYLGPFTSISDECVIEDSEIEHSIVLERSRIGRLAMRVEGSLVGKDVVIRATDARPRSYRFMIGDSCCVDVV
ncbi:MAG TPA: glucose-1-phosphate thymidylyltransferase [Candidatus Saccharimonadales bacterium]|nr:glucose-1-phosphate thymidylyltransferase [Candidatus Saccharimonadales bacterium]